MHKIVSKKIIDLDPATLGCSIPEKEYRTAPAISRSELWRMKESPEKFLYYRNNPPAPTEALLFGQAFHKFILEPDGFYDEFDFVPAVDRRTKEGKAVYEEWKIGAEGKTIIPCDMMITIGEMREKVMADSYVSRLLDGVHERSFFWNDADTGEKCKCRTDSLYVGKNNLVIVDLKTCTDASYEAFSREVFKYGYDFQAAMYCEGVKTVTGVPTSFVLVAVEKKPPYAINIFQIDEETINHGYDTYRTLLGTYHECVTTDNWWGYLGRTHTINSIVLPAWLGGKEEL